MLKIKTGLLHTFWNFGKDNFLVSPSLFIPSNAINWRCCNSSEKKKKQTKTNYKKKSQICLSSRRNVTPQSAEITKVKLWVPRAQSSNLRFSQPQQRENQVSFCSMFWAEIPAHAFPLKLIKTSLLFLKMLFVRKYSTSFTLGTVARTVNNNYEERILKNLCRFWLG